MAGLQQGSKVGTMVEKQHDGSVRAFGYLFIIAGVFCLALFAIGMIIRVNSSWLASMYVTDTEFYMMKVGSMAIMGVLLIYGGVKILEKGLNGNFLIMALIMSIGAIGVIVSFAKPGVMQTIGPFGFYAPLVCCVPCAFLPLMPMARMLGQSSRMGASSGGKDNKKEKKAKDSKGAEETKEKEES